MILTVPYVYKAVVRQHRKRNPVTVRYSGETAIEVAEASAAEAPVAFRAPAARNSDLPVDTRWHAGRLWSPSVSTAHREPDVHRDVDWLASNTREGRGLLVGSHGSEHHAEEFPRRREDDDTVAEHHCDDEDEVLAALAGQARDVLVVDGHLWRPIREPVIELSTTNWGDTAHLRVTEVSPKDLGCHHYRLDQAGWIAACEPGHDLEHALARLGVEVLMPEVLAARTGDRALRAVADDVLDHMKGRIARLDRDHFDRFATLRDAVADFSAALDADAPADADALAGALTRALGHRGPVDPDDPDTMADWLMRRVANAIRRMEFAKGEPERDDVSAFVP